MRHVAVPEQLEIVRLEEFAVPHFNGVTKHLGQRTKYRRQCVQKYCRLRKYRLGECAELENQDSDSVSVRFEEIQKLCPQYLDVEEIGIGHSGATTISRMSGEYARCD